MLLRKYPLKLSLLLFCGGCFLGTGLWMLQKHFHLGLNISHGILMKAATPKISTNITLLGDTFSGYSTFRNDIFQAKLAGYGIGLVYMDQFDQEARASAMSQGQAEMLVTTLDQYLTHLPLGRIVGLIDRTIGADAVLLNTKKYPALKSLNDLKPLVQAAKNEGGKLGIVFASDTPSEFLAMILDIKFAEFSMEDFDLIKVADASEAWTAMQDQSRNIAIAVLWEPYVKQAMKEGYKVILSSKDAPFSIIDVIVASDRLIKECPEELSEFLEAYYQRLDTNIPAPKALNAQISEDGQLSPEEATEVINGIHFFSASEAESWMTSGRLAERIESISEILFQAGRIQGVTTDPNALFRSKFLKKASLNTQVLIDQLDEENPDLANRLRGTASRKNAGNQTISGSNEIGNLDVKGNVQFEVGSHQLTAIGRQTLDKLAQEIREFNPATVAVRVIGHTSHTGSEYLNQTISQNRAQVVVDYLVSQGVEHNMEAIGKGFAEPLPEIAPTDIRNQRTQINLVRVGSLESAQPQNIAIEY